MRVLAAFLLLWPAWLLAHGGGLDDQGGHTNRETGRYHCHQQACSGQRAETAAGRRATTASYDREAWPHWRDANGDCRDTRADVLIRTSHVPVSFRHTERCIVATGLWIDPYTGRAFRDAGELDIDHLVPLRHAFRHGGRAWSPRQRAAFANDPDNLIPVSASANRSKGADAPQDWLPDNRGFWCEYGRRWSRIKREYQLRATPEAGPALKRLSHACDSARISHR